MKTQPIAPARIEFGATADEPPRAPDYGDLYHPRIGAQAQAQHVFVQGNGLPQRWAGRADFVILETGFGLGNNFLATWGAWRQEAQRCTRLHYVAVERHPLRRADLQRALAGTPWPELAQALLQAWPALTPNLHTLDFDEGRVRLSLALGDVAALLPTLRLAADAFYLDGFAPARNPQMWQPRVLKALGRLAAPGATLATWSVARELRDGLVSAGFELQRAPGIGGKREITVARFNPRFAVHRPPALAAPNPSRSAVVVGAGLAGAAAAQALARLGLQVTVLEQQAQPASGTSSNLGGLFHGTLIADDGPHTRLYRAAALAARAEYAAAVTRGTVPGGVQGLLRLGPDGGWSAMHALLQRLGLPPEYVQVLGCDEASARAGVPLPADCWWYPGGGWVSPAAWVRHALATPGVRTLCQAAVGGLHADAEQWCLLGLDGRELARAPVVVLAHAQGVGPLLGPLGLPDWPLQDTRGQVTHWPGTATGSPSPLRLPVAGDGYALPLPDGGLLCGATRQNEDADTTVRLADHQHNLQRLLRLTGLQPPPDAGLWQGRVGWRLQSSDRLPVAGALPLWPLAPGQRLDQARLLPRRPGLFVLTALGARGLTLAPLMARLVAAQATGTPWPLEQDLADAVDPARWLVRQARLTPAAMASGG